MNLQKTIKTEAKIAGKGLFGGQEAKLVFRSAPVDTGVVFVRTDVDEPIRIRAVASNVAERSRRTALRNDSVSVETVEHCLAAVKALEIDNLIIEIEGPELPAPDCSSTSYLRALQRAGIVEQQERRKEFTIREPVSIFEGDASIYALPYDGEGLHITYELDYIGHTGIGRQIFSCSLSAETFEKNLAGARTFLLEAEAKQFQAAA